MAAPYIYNAVNWTADKLISDIRRKAKIPASTDYTDEVILEVANEAIWSTLSVPELMNDGGRWGQTFTHTISGLCDTVLPTVIDDETSPLNRPGSVRGNGQEYELPPAVSAGTIKFVTYKESNGGREWQLQHLPHTDFFKVWFENQTASGNTWAYTLWENKLKVLPPAASSLSGTFRIYYSRRHPQVMKFDGNFVNIFEFIEEADEMGLIYTDATQTNPAWWPSVGQGGATYASCGVDDGEGVTNIFPFRWDIISSIGPHSHRVVDMDYTAIRETGGQLELGVNRQQYPLSEILPSSTNIYSPSDLRAPIGTFVLAAAGTSPYVHLTHELTEACALQAASSILRDIGSLEEAAAYDNKVERLVLRVQNQMAPRVKNAPLKVVNQNSIMRSVSQNQWRRNRGYRG